MGEVIQFPLSRIKSHLAICDVDWKDAMPIWARDMAEGTEARVCDECYLKILNIRDSLPDGDVFDEGTP